jgi:hypothetical protein
MANPVTSPPEYSTLPPPPAATGERPLRWFERPIAIGLMMLWIAPLGFVLLLAQPRWSMTRKLVILVVFGPICLIESAFFLNNFLATYSSTTPTRPAVTSHR